ncbi:bifunctional diaminohydroxyphosphoribosylaminopyrimidine deaminase/5-amino-6-(5-phosphoribosylamino)uracil reductase RibD [Salidesulfovibrio onnuriiensis]|uniref:bifunctional diaminohydroxyphosphoribosylaminopyrimidine deaminase/5-amino-6-(5-phosphoribosylamino)uracil reductase RibD n=1 Tax=Salidesulfovibrio onnuriiensis TaxID=2583823 RepID=UPI00202B553B|nr:bifunctional diaminohydroxyphosphoribosylaminopyrimidine deaminase/5-amino-6-(5-phosphoribosylamino)uracil reductase RibD [Salidesulfovibrio onnuriiensis]
MSCCKAISSPDKFMSRAMELARQGRGPTAPNPCVGAVLVHDGCIVAEGFHTAYGKPHAERECLAQAREKRIFESINPAQCTMYVTLEPCNHHGKTPPCSEAIIEAGVGKVVIGAMDQNPKAAGGAQRLREAGIEVQAGVMERECKDLIADFLTWQQTGRTYNILKMAATLDGKIASAQKKPEAVSGPESFARVHELRALADAVIVGGGTFYADNPSLTCRKHGLPENFRQPLAVVVTSRLPEPDANFTLLQDRPEQTMFWTDQATSASDRAQALKDIGVQVVGLPGKEQGLDLAPGFELLRREHGCHYTLCEGGGHLAMALAEQRLADELVHFVAPRMLGDASAPAAYSGRGNVTMAETLDWRIAGVERTGADVMLTLLPLKSS